jgi:hypothetical protein
MSWSLLSLSQSGRPNRKSGLVSLGANAGGLHFRRLTPYLPGMLRTRRTPSGFIEPCLPSPADQPPAGAYGEDLRREPFETRKATLSSLLRGCLPGLRINEHLPYPGDVVFRHACKMGLEGIVSKRLGSPYRSGRSKDWLKMKNPDAPAVRREAEEDWNGRRWR